MTICGTISDQANCSEESLAALNCCFGGEAIFVVTPEEKLVVEYSDAATCVHWCQRMNTELFRGERGVYFGDEENSAAKTCGIFYRLPETFWHIIKYIADGQVFYASMTNRRAHGM